MRNLPHKCATYTVLKCAPHMPYIYMPYMSHMHHTAYTVLKCAPQGHLSDAQSLRYGVYPARPAQGYRGEKGKPQATALTVELGLGLWGRR